MENSPAEKKSAALRVSRELRSHAARVRELWREASSPGVGRELSFAGPGPGRALSELLDLLSTLAISGAAYGYPAVTQQAARLSLALQKTAAAETRTDLRPLQAAIDRFELELLRASQLRGSAAPRAPRLFHSLARLVFILDDDELHSEWLEHLLIGKRYDVRVFRQMRDLELALSTQRPFAILVCSDQDTRDRDTRFSALNRASDLPSILIADDDRLERRLDAVQNSFDYFMCRPVQISALLSILEGLVELGQGKPGHVVLLSAEGSKAADTIRCMESSGLRVTLLDDPAACLPTLLREDADLVVVEGEFSTVRGLDLVAAIRQELQLANLPLLLLSDHPEDVALHYEPIAGDRVLQRPVEDDLLLATIDGQIRRARRTRQYIAHLHKEIHDRESIDRLTGLPNQNQIEERLGAELASIEAGATRRLALILMDIDNFQYINDAYGHASGDHLIADLGRRLKVFLPERAWLGRLGGDEFAVILPGLPEHQSLEKLLQSLMRVCDTPFAMQGDEIRIALSVGAAEHTPGSEAEGRVRSLFRNADAALYRAKAAGRNGYVIFHPKMELELKRQLTLLSDLRQALEGDELFLVFQPQLALHDRSTVGAEVLLRWKHPARGLISPAEFIPLAETHGLIGELGDFVLRSAIGQIAQWQKTFGRSVRLAVNVSPRQFSSPDFVPRVAELLKQHGVPSELLELEITETALASDLEQAVQKLVALRALRVTTAIDDFGTGFSNLASLKRYPVDLLKIDRSFVQGLPTQENDVAIVNAIIQMAKALGLKLLAEGVETAEQSEHLHSYQCDYAQGFLYARPMALEEFEARSLAG